MTTKTWTKCQWPFGEFTGACYKLSIRSGCIYLRDDGTKDWTFTVSCGPDSERSYTGMIRAEHLVEAQSKATASELATNSRHP